MWTHRETDYEREERIRHAAHIVRYAYLCPTCGQECEDRTQLSTNRGIYCRSCANTMICSQGCGWEGHTSSVSWVSNDRAADLGLMTRNGRDGGAYGVCPGCRAALVHQKGSSYWLNDRIFVAAGGRRVDR